MRPRTLKPPAVCECAHTVRQTCTIKKTKIFKDKLKMGSYGVMEQSEERIEEGERSAFSSSMNASHQRGWGVRTQKERQAKTSCLVPLKKIFSFLLTNENESVVNAADQEV